MVQGGVERKDAFKSHLHSHALRFSLAGVSNMTAAAITNPVNVVKVRMQLDGALVAGQERYYKGIFRGIARIAQEEGVLALWKGTSAALLREASYSSIRMGAYEPLKELLGAHDPAHTPLWKKLVASATAGMIGSAIANPTDVVMIRMQARRVELTQSQVLHRPQEYKSTLGAFRQIAAEEGLRGLYRGVGPTVQRAGLLTAAQVSSYDHTKHLLLSSGAMREGTVCHLTASMTAGLITALVTAPVDLVKTRIMQQAIRVDGSNAGALYTSATDCLRKTCATEGFFGLYKGFFPVWLRIGPHTIITFYVFEKLRKSFGLKPM
ncbi:mitochondrial substrate carrier protein [Klebsormidium nitens]|uniref:Mitochondrial substrate carrier protein n=1 Tax=Klebsormidium nitens TaxID=105231 RepID=A0A1Y1IC67_KLENI|nr:mitochondrial substrate carrier protein [Klebsormidium nitens]|eukprot:GAQ87019.1 mitochondrial substrate carrier protein [Klebsormidium nitens]